MEQPHSFADIRLNNTPEFRRPNQVFLLFFRVTYLSILAGHTAFTFLGFAQMGTAIGMVATVVVAVGSEVAFARAGKTISMTEKERRFVV
ncbi:hypothetical protein ACN47E_009106 [Coniothyrium glycines]